MAGKVKAAPKAFSSNFEKLKAAGTIGAKKRKYVRPTEKKNLDSTKTTLGSKVEEDVKSKQNSVSDGKKLAATENGTSPTLTSTVALDCEMVGVGEKKLSSLARVAIVNFEGDVLYDKFVRQKEKVTDYRTAFSGIKKRHLMHRKAEQFKVVQKEVAEMIKGRILVGHSINNDLQALLLTHPRKLIRDTAKYKPFMRNGHRSRALKDLVSEHLSMEIQDGDDGHDPAEDARAALFLYKKVRGPWEKHVMNRKHHK